VGRESTTKTSRAKREERARRVAEDLRALRRLSVKLHQHAARGNPALLRSIVLQREALLNSVRLNELSPEVNPEPEQTPVLSDEDRTLIHDTISDINTIDAKTERILKARAAKIGEEIMKLKAGKKYRDTSRRWT